VSHFFRRIRLDEQDPEYKRARFKVLAPTEGASRRTPAFLRDNWVAFNTWSASYALTHILEAVHHSDQYHLAILDRGIFDALAWFQVLEARGEISDSDMKKVHDFLLMDHWRSQVDAVFLFTADPATSMKRENNGKLIDAPGRAMNEEFIANLNEAYQTTRAKFQEQFKTLTKLIRALKQTLPLRQPLSTLQRVSWTCSKSMPKWKTSCKKLWCSHDTLSMAQTGLFHGMKLNNWSSQHPMQSFGCHGMMLSAQKYGCSPYRAPFFVTPVAGTACFVKLNNNGRI
jgi:hypothetical protein